jgi:CheY-like chemotaxis protein
VLHYTVLIVDDDKRLVDTLANECVKISGVKVLKAYNVDAALQLIVANFVHLALIDMEFDGRADGNRLFRRLADSRPSCNPLLLTRRPEEYRAEFFSLLDPLDPTIKGAIDKIDFKRTWHQIVASKAVEWLSNVITVGNSGPICEALSVKLRDIAVALTADEVDYVISRLFGQGTRSLAVPVGLATVEPEMMAGGRSTSVVLRTRPTTKDGRQGIWTVIKLSPRNEAAEEYERYCSFVRFLVSLDARVELLGFIQGDTIGAICYSFAGKSPTSVCSLSELFVEESERAIQVLGGLFRPESQCWYGISGDPVSVQAFFKDAYALDPPQLLPRFKKVLEHVKNSLPDVKISGDDLIWRSQRIFFPGAAMGSTALRTPYQACVVHGDMNAGNIIVAEDNRVMMIDYRHTTFGPRALDFAALESSVRLDSTNDDSSMESIVGALKDEGAIWKRIWRVSSKAVPQAVTGGSSGAFWTRMSLTLMQHARINFPDMTETEYAATCFGWALRVMRVSGLSVAQRSRIIVWMSALCPVLERGA